MHKAISAFVCVAVLAFGQVSVTDAGAQGDGESAVRIAVEACRLSDVSLCDLDDDTLWVKNATTPFGRSVRWRLTLINDSDATVGDVALTKVTPGSCDAATGTHDALAPGETRRLTCQTSDIDEGSLLVVYLDAVDGLGNAIHDRDSARTYVREGVEAFTIEITGCAGSTSICAQSIVRGQEWLPVASVGPAEELWWRIDVRNTGNRELRDLVVAATNAGCNATLNSLPHRQHTTVFCSGGSIESTATLTVFASASAASGGSLSSTETAVAAAGAESLLVGLTACGEATCVVTDFGSAIGARPGSAVTWQATVTNTGDHPIADIVVTHLGDSICALGLPAMLLPGETSATSCTTIFDGDTTMAVAVAGQSTRTSVVGVASAVVIERN